MKYREYYLKERKKKLSNSIQRRNKNNRGKRNHGFFRVPLGYHDCANTPWKYNRECAWVYRVAARVIDIFHGNGT